VVEHRREVVQAMEGTQGYTDPPAHQQWVDTLSALRKGGRDQWERPGGDLLEKEVVYCALGMVAHGNAFASRVARSKGAQKALRSMAHLLRAAERASLEQRREIAQELADRRSMAQAWVRLRVEVLLCSPGETAARREARKEQRRVYARLRDGGGASGEDGEARRRGRERWVRRTKEEEGGGDRAGERRRWVNHSVEAPVARMGTPLAWMGKTGYRVWRWAAQLRRWRLRAVSNRAEPSRVLVEVAGLAPSQLHPQARRDIQEEEGARALLREAEARLAFCLAVAGLGAAARAWRAGKRRAGGKRKAQRAEREGEVDWRAKRPRARREEQVREHAGAAARKRARDEREEREEREEVEAMMEEEEWEPGGEWELERPRGKERRREPDATRGTYLGRIAEAAGIVREGAGAEPGWRPPVHRGGWGGQGEG